MAKISIKGAIIPNNDQWIYDWLEMDATSPRMVNQQIENAKGQDLEVEINSGGGSVFDGSEIYTSLKSYPGNVTVKIVGLAASAASVIAMAGDKILMSPTSQMMIHNASVNASGDYRTMEHTSEILKNVNKTVSNAYRIKSGMDEETLLQMMNNETWLTPQQAIDLKLIDQVMFENDNQLSIVASTYDSQMLPQNIINKIRNELRPSNSKKMNEVDIFMQKKAKAQLNLLKLKGEFIDE